MKNWILIVLTSAMAWSCQNTKSSEPELPINQPAQEGAFKQWLNQAVIYEVNTRQFSASGRFEAVEAELPRLKELGVDILWFMPIHPIGEKNRKGSLGSYYAVKDYRGINPEFGELADFQRIVDKAHELEMKVVIDWVANHTAWDHHWIDEHPDFYSKDSTGNIIPPNPDWSDVADLNYDEPALRDAMMADMAYWIDSVNIDGFRCDVAGEVPLDFWEPCITALRAKKEIFMLAEWDEPKMHSCFDATYGWGYHHTLMEIGKGAMQISELRTYFEEDIQRYEPHHIRMRFNTNHDENTWKGTEVELFGAMQHNFMVLAFTAWGMPLIYNGQEAGLDKRLAFFEKDEINWDDTTEVAMFQALTELKHQHPALSASRNTSTFHITEADDETGTFVFERRAKEETLRIVMNFGNEPLPLEEYATDQVVFKSQAFDEGFLAPMTTIIYKI